MIILRRMPPINTKMITLISLINICIITSAFAQEKEAPKTVRVYFMGNSVTDNANYKGIKGLAAKNGITQEWGRHMIPGTPLFLLLEESQKEKPGGFTERPYGACLQALSNYQWDIITVQPFDRHIHKGDKQSDLYVINKLIETSKDKSPEVQFFIYSRWPRKRIDKKAMDYDKDAYDVKAKGDKQPDWRVLEKWQQWWDKEYTGGWDGTNETRDYFTDLMKAIREANPDMKKSIRIIPVGDVMYALDKKMQAGEVPGFKSIYNVYKDGIHLGPYGSYIAGLTFATTMYKIDPRGLSFSEYGKLDPKVVKIIQETVWEVVSKHPYAGIAAEPETREQNGNPGKE